MSVHNFPAKPRAMPWCPLDSVALRSNSDITGVVVGDGLLPDEVKVQWDDTGDITHISKERLSQSAGLHALLICSAILETAKKLQADLNAIKAVAEEVRAELEGMK